MLNLSQSIVDFNGTAIQIHLINDDVWMTAESIGIALGYKDPRNQVLKIFNQHHEELELFSTTAKLAAVDQKSRDMRVFNEEGVMIITMLSRQPKAAEFRRWAVQVLKAYRHGLLVSTQPEPIQPNPGQMLISKDVYIELLEAHCELLHDKLDNQQPRERRPFTEEEKRLIRIWSAEGVSKGEIARRLDRNPGSISGYLLSLRSH